MTSFDEISRNLGPSSVYVLLMKSQPVGLFNGLYFRSIITTTGRSIRLILTPISLNALIANKNMNGSGQLIFPRLNNIHPSIHLPVLPFYPSLYNECCYKRIIWTSLKKIHRKVDLFSSVSFTKHFESNNNSAKLNILTSGCQPLSPWVDYWCYLWSITRPHIESWTKWPTLSTRHCEMYFLDRKFEYFDSHVTMQVWHTIISFHRKYDTQLHWRYQFSRTEHVWL